jgi:hypothetical protein
MVVTLLAFIVVLLVGLAAYTRIETSIAGNSQRQAQARENALLALNVAVGQLQRYAGPDTRVTATAHNFGGANGTLAYTGVWSSDPAATEGPTTPLTWLVSGNEFTQPDPNPDAAEGSTIPAPRAVVPGPPGNRTVDLVGRNSTGSATRSADYVVAPLAEISSPGVPGALPGTSTVIGRYAWWVGDQGVKAAVALPDTSSTVTFAPYDSADLRGRIRQQVPLGAGAADASGNVVFEPRDSNNSSLIAGQKITMANQFAFLRNAANAQLGLTRARQNFHVWSPNNYAVLANTKLGGLRQDLSLQPSLLGGAFSAWANYSAYMENFLPVPPSLDAEGNPIPVAPATTPVIAPEYSSDPLRRRYVMTPHVRSENGSHQVGPVLADFGITFNVRTVLDSGDAPSELEVRAAWMLSLWNPYTSALVPEELRIEVEGLPGEIAVVSDDPTSPVVSSFSIPQIFGAEPPPDGTSRPMVISLPWVSTDLPEGTPIEDRQSWLPGRIYTWRSIQAPADAVIPATGYSSEFYTRMFAPAREDNQGVKRQIPGSAIPATQCSLVVKGERTLTVTLYVIRSGEKVRIGQFVSPEFQNEFSTTQREISKGTYQFGYAFRLKESIDTPASPSEWLTTQFVDFRRFRLQSEAYVLDRDDNPSTYENKLTDFMTAKPGRLLFRPGTQYSYTWDVPVFEFPRAPILSLGALQHFRVWNSRPFMIGNSWGANYELNGIRLAEIFDRFFVTGLVDGVTPISTSTGDLILPNPLMKPVRSWDASLQAYRRPTIDDIRAMMNPPMTTDPDGNSIPSFPASSQSSKFLLQGGAFNFNSTNAAAWAAVLRGVRFPTSSGTFKYLNPSDSTGSGADSDVLPVQSDDAQFFRFSQSAQETYQVGPRPDEDGVTPAPGHLFRRGMRTLTAAQVGALAARIVELMGVKQAAEGPFRSLEEFVSASALFAGADAEGNVGAARSLLEAAVADAGINAEIAEFSSQWLTQGDILTALAPVLFPRSDTFVIRTYGEVVNPSTNATEGRAWCEAIVQRVPEYLDTTADAPEVLPGALTSALNQQNGRRFKVISFRWLTRADI